MSSAFQAMGMEDNVREANAFSNLLCRAPYASTARLTKV